MNAFDILTAAGFGLAVAPHFWRFSRDYYRTWITGAFWDGHARDYTVVFPYHKGPGSDVHRYVTHEDVSAARKMEEFLVGHGKNVDIKRSVDSLTDQQLGSNVVIVGSSRTNEAVHRYFSCVESKYSFGASDDEYYIYDKSGAVRIVSPKDKGEPSDFALIKKMANPHCPSNRVYYVAGIHAVGTWAAAEYLTSWRRLKRMPRVAANQALVAIIEARFSGFYTISHFDDFLKPRIVAESSSAL